HDGEVRLPMVEEAADRRLEVDRGELMDDAVAETFGGEARRQDRPRRQHHPDAVRQDRIDEADDGGGLALARRVDPYQRARRPRDAGMAVALAAAGALVAALAGARGHVAADQGIGCGARPAIGRQDRACPACAHAATPALLLRIEKPGWRNGMTSRSMPGARRFEGGCRPFTPVCAPTRTSRSAMVCRLLEHFAAGRNRLASRKCA